MIPPASLRRGDRMQDLQDCSRNPSVRDQGSSCSPVGPCLWALLFSRARGTAGSGPGPAALLQPYSKVWVGWGVLPPNLGTALTRMGEHSAPPAGGACWSGTVPAGGTEEGAFCLLIPRADCSAQERTGVHPQRNPNAQPVDKPQQRWA